MIKRTSSIIGRLTVYGCAFACTCLGLLANLNYVENVWPTGTPEFSSDTYRLERMRLLGPVYESDFRTMTALRPLQLELRDTQKQEWRGYLLPPFWAGKYTPTRREWSMFGLIRSRTLKYPSGREVYDGMAFPIWFMRDTGDPKTSYKAVFPLCGKIYNFLGNDEMRWYLWPLWLYTRQRDEEHFSFPWPFIRWQRGPKSHGWALWPLHGHFEQKGKYANMYCFWPLMYDYRTYKYKGQQDPNIPRRRSGFLPFYALETSDNVRDVSAPWPFMGYRIEKSPKYNEMRFLWPIWVQGRGEEKYVNRVAPFYTHSIKHGLDKQWFCWPFIKVQHWQRLGIHFEQAQFLYFLIWHQNQRFKNEGQLCFAEKTHVWPLCSYWNDGMGRIQFQMFSPFEVFLQHSDSVRQLYTPLFALYKFNQKNADTTEESVLFNLINERREKDQRQLTVGPLLDYRSEKNNAKFELLKGLLGYSKVNDRKVVRLFWMKFETSPKKS